MNLRNKARLIYLLVFFAFYFGDMATTFIGFSLGAVESNPIKVYFFSFGIIGIVSDIICVFLITFIFSYFIDLMVILHSKFEKKPKFKKDTYFLIFLFTLLISICSAEFYAIINNLNVIFLLKGG